MAKQIKEKKSVPGRPPHIWKHGGRDNLITMRIPRQSKDLIYRVAVLIDNQVIGNVHYDKNAVLQQIKNILP